MNSFFLSISCPRLRWQANCVFRSIATRKRNETLCLWLEVPSLRGDRGKPAYTGQNHFYMYDSSLFFLYKKEAA